MSSTPPPSSSENLPHARPVRRAGRSRGGRSVAFLWIAAAIVVSQGVDRGWPSAIVAACVASAAAVVVSICLERVRAARTHRVIEYVAQATRLAMPLPDFCRVAALGETRGTRAALERVAGLTAGATPVADALAEAVPTMSPRDVNVARVGEANGALPSTMARLAAVRGVPRDPLPPDRPSPFVGDASRRHYPPLYAALFLLLIPAVCTMLMTFVVPKFAQIFRDFGVAAPPWMRWIGRTTVAGLALEELMLLLAGVALLLWLTLIVRSFSKVGRWRRSYKVGTRFDASRRRPPARPWSVVARLWRDQDYADVCQAMADALVARRPADVAIAEAATLAVGPGLADRLEAWRSLVAAGRPIGEAARAAGLPALVADLAGAEPTGPADAFAFLARHYRGRAERTHEWLVAMATPAVTLAASLPVALIAYALFDCMRRIADASMPTNLGM